MPDGTAGVERFRTTSVGTCRRTDEGDVMRTVKWMSTGLCAGLLFSAGLSFAESAPQATTPVSATAPADRPFLVRALGVNHTELLLGRMALERGKTQEVKAMGEKMVQRHTEFARQLGELAQTNPAAEPPTLTVVQQQTVSRLAAVSDRDFDRSFKKTVDAGHVDELAMYREEVGRAADPRLRAFATGRVTALEQSLASASQESSMPAKKHDW
jgi:putative membrane protein